MPRFKNVNGIRIQLTAEEETARDIQIANELEKQQAEADAEIAKQARIASAKAKLEALGLTSDEVRDTFGLGDN